MLELEVVDVVGAGSSALTARLSWPRGETSGAHAFDRAVVGSLSAEMASIIRRGTLWGDRDLGSRALLRERGEVMFELVLPPPVKEALRLCDCRELEVRVGPELAPLPFELLHDGRDFLGLRFALGRTRPDAGRGARVARLQPRSAAPRALVVCDPRGDLLHAYDEGLSLRDELSHGWGAALDVDLRSTEVRRADVARILKEYDIVHFAGHVEPADDGGRGWALRDGVLGPAAIRAVGGGDTFPRMVFTNACASADGRAAGEESTRMAFAQAFLDAGAEHYIGTIEDVPDEPASVLAATFYEALRASPDVSVGEALRRGRLELARRYGDESTYWAAWVLHGSPLGNPVRARAGDRDEVRAPLDDARDHRGFAGRDGETGAIRELGQFGARRRGAAAGRMAPIWTLEAPSWRRLVAPLGTALLALAAALVMGLVVPRAQGGSRVEGRSATPWTEGVMRGLGPGAERVFIAPVPRWTANVPPSESTEEAPQVAISLVRRDGPAGSPLRLGSGESFRLALALPTRGWFALWHLESQGTLRRLAPGGALGLAASRGPRELPEGDRWYWLDDRTGTERFVLVWSAEPPDGATLVSMLEGDPNDPDDLGLEALSRRLVDRLRARPGRSVETFRGLGGTRDEVTWDRAAPARLIEAMRGRLRATFDVVIELEVEHR